MFDTVAITIFSLVVLLFSVIIHELAHGSVAYSLGDPTAKYAGRLTLNPLKHLDLFGSIILPLLLFIAGSPFLFGWAKPVPINPYNFTDKKYGEIKVSVAGPASNLSIAIVFGLILRFIPNAVILNYQGVGIALTDEREDGSTPLTDILNSAFIHAVEDDMGIDEDGRIVTDVMLHPN